ncbi:MAG: response regulator [Methylomicrobium sp.]
MPRLTISDLSIVLIEPSIPQLKTIVKHLQEAGVQYITGVSSGEEAIEAVRNYHPDLLISSMYLPDTTATDLFTRIKESDQFPDMQCMLISSETSRAALEPIRQAGVVAILPKPFDHADLTRALRASIEFVDPEELELNHYDIEAVRVLLVDDSLPARKHIAKVLNNMGIQQIVMAKDGKEGLAIFSESPDAFDLIVTDYNMPEMDGQELIEIIRTRTENSSIPILMVTSESNQATLNEIRHAGVSAICDKPFEPQNIKELVYCLLEEY